ncbi:hypothetical protein [Neobacillus ginsengisoli]|uniref:Uncharacterized protein n=1 Tax=Neobacillus ginsengisoli TaxID=904295 RepID=A0ABT9XTD0_9BACI|nr:hypothetical protein [Neobacillus ginsengisoli]MDQ0198817.1 hypothetical protein [Neobacillus ginsengisoli]
MSYSVDPDPSRRGEVNIIFELIALDSSRISALEKVGWLPQTLK